MKLACWAWAWFWMWAPTELNWERSRVDRRRAESSRVEHSIAKQSQGSISFSHALKSLIAPMVSDKYAWKLMLNAHTMQGQQRWSIIYFVFVCSEFISVSTFFFLELWKFIDIKKKNTNEKCRPNGMYHVYGNTATSSK